MPDPMTSLFSAFTQTIGRFIYDPTTNWQHFFNPQWVFNFNPQDEAVEGHVLSRVGSYGSQIDKLIDVIEVLKSRADLTGLDAAAQAKVDTFDALSLAATEAVAEFRGKLSASDILAGAKALRERDAPAAAALAALLQDALTGPPTEPGPEDAAPTVKAARPPAKAKLLSTDHPTG